MKKQDLKNKQILSAFNNDLNDLVFFSFRYFLGRMTAKVSFFTKNLIAAWPSLNDKTKNQIRKELEKAIEEDDRIKKIIKKTLRPQYFYPLGMDCDRECWMNVMSVIKIDEKIKNAKNLEKSNGTKWSDLDVEKFYRRTAGKPSRSGLG